MTLIKGFEKYFPIIDNSALIADSAAIIGRVKIDKDVNIWYGAVIRGDIDEITIGEGTNIQDNCIVHVTEGHPCIIGKHCTIGHNAIIHSAKIGDNVLIGMGAIILDDAVIEDNCIIGAGALVTGGKVIKGGSMVFGNPAKFVRYLNEDEIKSLDLSYRHYIEIAKSHFKKLSN
ncbi:gamma carbonic anhydrase family protein [Thermoanaerobacterium thermosaccharolyticum]|uniref:gamma carbonic anhydrase family protein n=1 Tax=Thermoanaerobacterium thermosaccharolyticum TaxID=1517 RepID=UPI0017873C54|nr:gamma carbonic anhydrase family protein [Thermoanaerobacterium thermosaccharolyticum]MBE0069386.1 gamma carbonic anhydrase family protein [Thermoanaerobacterium thermosaccharolyticum]MBE0228219.1 gamma carbonic anhydrase family protein [Thermoanaerobacterium thermosaccharolyticum]